MDKNLRIELLKQGGKTKLEQYNRLNRVIGPDMNLGTSLNM